MSVLSRNAKIAIAAVFCSFVFFFAAGGALAWAQTYEGRVGPNSFVGSVEVSGMNPEEAARAIEERMDAFYASGVTVTLDDGQTATLPLAAIAGADSTEIVRFHVDETVRAALALSHEDGGFANALALLRALARPNRTGAFVTADAERVAEAVRAAFPGRESPPVDASFAFARGPEGWTVEARGGTAGESFDLEPFLPSLLGRLSALDSSPVPLRVTHRDPEVSLADAQSQTDEALAALGRAPLALAAADGRSWPVDDAALASLLVPAREMGPLVDVGATALEAFLVPVAAAVEIEARDARFIVENGRASEFVGSREGVSVNREELRARLAAAARGEAPPTVDIPTFVVEPEVTTDEANDLGIGDALGTGTSSFRGSPQNRIKNIKNGVALLNGRLIAPGETFSLLAALKPFELENGYFPELVIKGDKIQPEIGGGLCQIGTTTFRAAMNAGLPIVERSNHSLVVSYYNDPSNGNPGTDATIYDPAPDFRFMNDTEHYVLFQAEMDETNASLAFTLWGTNDGRIGSYSPPVVERWIGVGDTVNVETLDLPPGKKKCQAAHVGADASFTYSVTRPDGTTEKTEFASHYRPLPEICLVGVEQLSTQETLPPPADGVSSSQTSDAPADGGDAQRTDDQTKTE